MQFSNSLVIRRSPEDVFRALADPGLIPRWNPAIAAARLLTPGPVRHSSRIQLQRTSPQPATEEIEVTEHAAPLRLVFRGDLGPLNGDLVYELEPVTEGTRLTNRADLEASGPLRLLAPLAVGRVRASVADNLEGLRRLLEASITDASAATER